MPIVSSFCFFALQVTRRETILIGKRTMTPASEIACRSALNLCTHWRIILVSVRDDRSMFPSACRSWEGENEWISLHEAITRTATHSVASILDLLPLPSEISKDIRA